ncbi:Cytochrome protein, partial [Ophiophagus hannah]
MGWGLQSTPGLSWQMGKEYGPVFTVFLGLQRVVVLCGYQAVKEALVDQAEEFSGRGQLPAFSKDFNHHGIVFANGQRWQQLRRFSLTTLRNFGMGKRSIEERIQEEAQCLVEELRKAEGMPFDPTFLLSRAVSNVICSVVFGNRFEYSDEKFLRLNKLITERFRIASSTEAALYNIFPEIMEKIPGAHHAGHRCSQQIIGFIKERIQMQQASLDPCAPQNYIDCFLAKMEQEKHNPDSEFCMENLVMATFNLFFAGTETISTTLRFGFLILMKHPQVQATPAPLAWLCQFCRLQCQLVFAKLLAKERGEGKPIPEFQPNLVQWDGQQKQIASLLGKVLWVADVPKQRFCSGRMVGILFGYHQAKFLRPPALDSITEMPFSPSFPSLAMRAPHSGLPSLPLSPLSLLLCLLGCSCQGTYVYPLLSTVHYDAEHHAGPEQFEPQRFLDSHGRFKRADAFMPFSAGKRLCLGEGLARMELFLFLTTILQAFTLTSLVPLGEVSIVPDASGVSRVPMRYQLLVVPRQA